MKRLGEWFAALIDVREGEAVPVTLLTLYGFLALASFHLIKPVRNAIFLNRVGSESLPAVYALTAAIVIVLSVVYSRVAERADRRRLLQGTLGVLAMSLVGFWWWLRWAEGSIAAAGAFYIWAKLYPLALVSQFWLVGNLLFTTRQAKRLFGPIGTGLILGGIAGAAVSGEAADAVGPVNLLLIAAGLLVACAALLPRVLAEREGSRAGDARLVDELSADGLSILRDSSHLKTVAGALGLAVVVATLVDWQFNRAVDLFIEGEDAKTVFFGRFFALTNLAAAGIQVLLTAFVLRRLGIAAGALALPAVLFFTGFGVVLAPVLLTTAILKGAESALRYSLDQSTRELVYLPVPTEAKFKVKPLIDLGVHRGAGGVAGLLLILLVNGLGFSIRGVAIATLVIAVAWAFVALRLRGEFRSAVRRLIGIRDIELDELILEHLGAETIAELRGALTQDDEQKILFALSLLKIGPPAGLEEELKALLRHDSERVRVRAIEALHDIEAVDAVEEVEGLLEDSSLNVRREAVKYLCGRAPEPAARMERFLDEEEDVREAAVACLVQHGDEAQVERGLGLLKEMARGESEQRRGRAAMLFGSRDDLPAEGREILSELIRDPEPDVRREAIRAIGRARLIRFTPLLIERQADHGDRRPALEALGSMGAAIHDDLLDALDDGTTPRLARILIPRLLHPDAAAATVERLTRMLTELPPGLRYESFRVLNKLRRDRDDLEFDREHRERLVEPEIERAYVWTVAVADLEESEADGPEALLRRTLRQRRGEAIERAFRALGLWLPLEDLYAAFTALGSPDPVTRDRGFELLENVLALQDREALDPLVDPERTLEDGADAGERRFGIGRMDREARLEALAGEDDFWVSVLARRTLGRPLLPDARLPAIESGRADTLLATAGPFEDEERLMDVIERAELLSRAEMFCELSTEDLVGLATLVEEAEHEAGDEIFAEGEAGGVLHLVAEGRVEARKGDRVLFDAEPGKSVGSLSLVDGLPTDYAAVAVEDSRTLVLERADFTRMMDERPPVARSVMTYLTGVIRGLNEPPDG